MLLFDQQINARTRETFIHTVRQIVAFTGVREGSNLRTEFDPAYQKVSFHWARIWRGTNELNRLDPEKSRIVSADDKSSGFQVAELVLPDVRVGDVVDFACTVQGHNPVFGDKFSGHFDLQQTNRVERLSVRLLWPPEKSLYLVPQGCSARATVLRKGDMAEYTWGFGGVAALQVEDWLPAWFNPAPWIQVSEFKNWSEVNQWALQSLFTDKPQLSGALATKIAEWRGITTGREQQIMAVLQFLQEEIAYEPVEIGSASRRLLEVSDVFEKRSGNSRDKVLLFTAVLRALGIEAYPVLVHTRLRSTIQQLHPTPRAFNHAISQVRLGNQTFWLDLSSTYQRGPLSGRAVEDYGRGLVVTPRTTALSAIPQNLGFRETLITEYFDLNGKFESAELRVVTQMLGAHADDFRKRLATTERSRIEEAFLRDYVTTYSGVVRNGSMMVDDDTQLNHVQVVNHYTIGMPWTRPAGESWYICGFPTRTSDFLEKPSDTTRSMPLDIGEPERFLLRTEISLPRSWQFNKWESSVSDAAFSYRSTCKIQGRTAVMEMEVRRTADSVAPGRMAEYVNHIETALNTPGLKLMRP